MAKSTRHGGDSYTTAEIADPEAPIRIRRAELGKVDKPSVPEDGTDSFLSSESEPTKSEHVTVSPPPLAPTTENPSKLPTVEVSTVHSTGGGTRKTPPRQSVKKENPKAARVRSIDEDEFDEFD